MLLLGAQCHGLWQEGDCQKQGLSTGRATPEADDVLLAFQVAEMHGELIEFNERLHRALVAKEALVSQMRQELIDLRGPVSALHQQAGLSPASSLCLLSVCVHQASATHRNELFHSCWCQ